MMTIKKLIIFLLINDYNLAKYLKDNRFRIGDYNELVK